MAKITLPKLSLLGAALLLGGCSMIPKYERPAAPVAGEWPVNSTAVSTAATPAADIEWQSFFSDAKLRQLIAASLQSNRDLRVAVLNIEQARAQFQIRRADQYPTVNVAATGSRQPARAANGSTFIAST